MCASAQNAIGSPRTVVSGERLLSSTPIIGPFDRANVEGVSGTGHGDLHFSL